MFIILYIFCWTIYVNHLPFYGVSKFQCRLFLLPFPYHCGCLTSFWQKYSCSSSSCVPVSLQWWMVWCINLPWTKIYKKSAGSLCLWMKQNEERDIAVHKKAHSFSWSCRFRNLHYEEIKKKSDLTYFPALFKYSSFCEVPPLELHACTCAEWIPFCLGHC